MIQGAGYAKKQLVGIMYLNICTRFGLETLRSNWDKMKELRSTATFGYRLRSR